MGGPSFMLMSASEDELRFTHTATGWVGSFTLATCSRESMLSDRNGSMLHQPWWGTASPAGLASAP